jgi:NAD(P)-dependent dehydrogenase (short-subunit alcohol dehydrogenase family)
MRLQDKVAIVTGAASGMGAATALLFAREGARVVVADLLAAESEQVVSRIKEAGGEARFQHLDVTREKDWGAVAANLAA